MKVGVTGTHHGSTPEQRARLASLLRHPTVTEVHHGDCIDVDAFAHDVAFEAGKLIVVHPPTDSKLRAFKGFGVTPKFEGQITWWAALPYLDRNLDIVSATIKLYAAPIGPERMRGSGTWATIRYARKYRRPITFVWPDGEVTYE